MERVEIRDLAQPGHSMRCPYEGLEWGVWRIRRKKRIPRFARNDSLVLLLASGPRESRRGDFNYQIGDLRFVGIADDPGDAGEGG